ncbi:MAG: elongation factor G [Chloroflexi bacterium]|nr:elongation factor G [Chloroflexota bacterium]
MQVFTTERLRNTALLSHNGAGKTSLVEALLYATGAITRQGRVDDGNTVSDYEPEEIKRRSSIQLSLVPILWNDHKVNLLDTPGYADFIGEVIAALRVCDEAILVVSAVAGMEVGTALLYRRVQDNKLPSLIFISKMDRENADFDRAMESIQKIVGKKAVPLQVPLGAASTFKGVVSLLPQPEALPPEVENKVEKARERLVEAIAETDETLATKFLEGETLSDEELMGGLKRGVADGQLVPILCGSAFQGTGMRELLDAVLKLLPGPAERGPVTAKGPRGEQLLQADPGGPLTAFVFKTSADPYVGKLSYFRVYRGTIKSDSQVFNGSKSQMERLGQIFVLRGKAQEQVAHIVAGDIGVMAKLAYTSTGDTLCEKDTPCSVESLRFPTPYYSMAVLPKSKADLDKMTTSLTRLREEDPSLDVRREQGTGETLLVGYGDAHLDVALERVKRKFGAELVLQLPKVPYRETIAAPTQTEYKHRKQTGGHGQYGHVFLRLEPTGRGGGFQFQSAIAGGVVPREYISWVEKGVAKALQDGVLAGFPVVDLKVTLYDGSYHDVDSSGICFEIAGSHALRKGALEASPILLEPILKLEVVVPEGYSGDIIGDLNSKRGRILGMIPEGDGHTRIEAHVPQAELLRYALELRSITQGRGSFTVAFDHYEDVPPHLTQRIVDQNKREKEAARA